ncbi:MAG: hypothetical protein WC716_13200 [Chitinophagaceae bacterium]|jgi:hypothetical protein
MANYKHKNQEVSFKGLLSNINASQFFPNFAPGVKNYPAKLSGNSGHNWNPYFSPDDIHHIIQGLKKLTEAFTVYQNEPQCILPKKK